MLFLTIMHAMPPEFLGILGQLSDVASDLSPEFLRGIEHVLFTIILN